MFPSSHAHRSLRSSFGFIQTKSNKTSADGRKMMRSIECVQSKSRAKKRAEANSQGGDDAKKKVNESSTATATATTTITNNNNTKEKEVTKQQRDKIRKQRAEKLRMIVSVEGKKYEKIQKDFQLTRESAREYVLSVRQRKRGNRSEASSDEQENNNNNNNSNNTNNEMIPLLVDWLPVAEILVADRVSLEAALAFKKLGMELPETDDNQNEPKKIDGVPAVTALLPTRKQEIAAMAFNIAGAQLRDIEQVDLEYGIEDWGSFENCVDGLAARSGDADQGLERAYQKLGASADEDPKEIKAKYRKLIATAHPDRNPDADVKEFNAIKDAYELIVGKDCGGASFEGLGTNRDFIVLDGTPAHFGDAINKKPMEFNDKTILFAMRSLVGYERVGQHFNARNVRLAKAKGMSV